MWKNNYLFLLSIALIIFISCNKNEKDNILISSIEVITLKSTISSNGGVRLVGSYISENTKVTEVGFEYAKDYLFHDTKIVIKLPKITSNKIEYFLGTGIVPNIKYYFRAFIKTDGKTYYGSVQSFVSNGSQAPKIDSISKEYGFIADTIAIYGKYFRDINFQTVVDFSNVPVQILILNDTLITCIVPANIKNVVNTINVKIDNRMDSFSSFSLLKPTVETIMPMMGTFRDEIVINGNNFDIKKSRTKVYFGNVEALVTYVNTNTLKVLVPDNLEKSIVPIKVVAQLQEAVYVENFKLIHPQINLLTSDVNANQEIVIKGAYFHPIKEKNKVTFEDIEGIVYSGDTKSLITKVPYGPFPRRKATVKVQVADITVEYKVDLTIRDKWVMVSNSIPFNYIQGVSNASVIGNQVYVIASSLSLNDTKLYLWKFNNADYSWEKINIPFALETSGISETDGKKLFVYTSTYINTYSNNFWAYDPSTQKWEKKADYPGSHTSGPTHFSLNGEIYVGLGNNTNSLYKYSPNNDTWTKMADFTHVPSYYGSGTVGFTINNVAYIGHGSSTTVSRNFWSYHPISDKWIQIADCPVAIPNTTGFVLGGEGYITGGGTSQSWKYNPGSNYWEQSHSIIKPRTGNFSFALNGKAYVGAGFGHFPVGTYVFYELYEYIP